MRIAALTSLAAILNSASKQLGEFSDSPRLEAEILLSLTTGKSRTYFRAWPEKGLSPQEEKRFNELLSQRLLGHPVAHLTGIREFWSRDFKVTSDVLIPRPETELLIELSLKLIPVNQTAHIADLGTGSGAIAVTLGLELPKAHITAVDLSPAALTIAADNASRLGAWNIRFVQSDWFAGLPCHAANFRSPDEWEYFDLIVSNPPYIAESDPHLRLGDVRFEPSLALTSGPDGLDAIRHIIQQSPKYLKPGGWLLFEHGYDQADRAGELLEEAGFVDVENFADLQAHARVSGGRRRA